MDNKTIVFLRADGDSHIGLGHIHRLLALGEMLKDHFKCVFVVRMPLAGIKYLILENSFEIVEIDGKDEVNDLKTWAKLLTGREIVVLDGYDFPTDYQQSIKRIGCGLVSIDDVHQFHFVGDVIINTAGGIDSTWYSKEPHTKLFIGPEFALIKSPFRQTKKVNVQSTQTSLFICMGGADPQNHTVSTLAYCLKFSFDRYFVVVGEAYAHTDALQRLAKNENRIEIFTNIKPAALAELMMKCTTAVCSASGIAYEYLSIGGELYVKQTASNQQLLYNFLCNEMLAFPFDDFRVDSQKVGLSELRQREIFDGNGERRILRIFNGLDFQINTEVRKPTTEDLFKTFEWANDRELRRQSYSSDPISLDEHTTWFNKKLTDPLTHMYIFVYKDTPVAVVRFDVSDEVIISFSVDRDYRSRGWGKLVLKRGLETFRQNFGRHINIVAYVKNENESSIRIFRGLGFSENVAKEYRNSYKYTYSAS